MPKPPAHERHVRSSNPLAPGIPRRCCKTGCILNPYQRLGPPDPGSWSRPVVLYQALWPQCIGLSTDHQVRANQQQQRRADSFQRAWCLYRRLRPARRSCLGMRCWVISTAPASSAARRPWTISTSSSGAVVDPDRLACYKSCHNTALENMRFFERAHALHLICSAPAAELRQGHMRARPRSGGSCSLLREHIRHKLLRRSPQEPLVEWSAHGSHRTQQRCTQFR